MMLILSSDDFFLNHLSVSNLFSLIQTTGGFMIPLVAENFLLHLGFRCNYC